jgi:phosphoglycolate phosphatase-like HAD superfamily hydrolase
VLWDIDRTLVYVGGIDRLVYREVFTELVGREPASLPAKGTGRTVPLATWELFVSNGVPDVEAQVLVPRALAMIPERFAGHNDLVRREGVLLPGAVEALRAVRALSDTVPTVVTGNLRPNAVLKLKTFGLDSFVEFELGGYASDDPHRPALVAIAQRRAGARYGAIFSAQNTVIIGDSLEDVTTGRQGGAAVLGIASGTTSVAELRAAGAGAVLDDLCDPGAVIASVLKLAPG